MFLSRLTIDVGNDPTRERPGRSWLRNLYHVHQRLCMGFPADPRKQRDPDFLAPYAPEDFPEQRHMADKKKTDVDASILKQVHSPRTSEAGFLFRIDPQPRGRAAILVQSAVNPDWNYAFHNAGYLLAAPPQVKPFDPSFEVGRRLRFRLLANPTKKIGTIQKEERQRFSEEELREKKGRHGRRVPVPSSEELSAWRAGNPHADMRAYICSRLMEWIESKAEPWGFSLQSVAVQPGYVYVNKEREGKGQRLRSARYDGVLGVTDRAGFREAIIRGIGPGKAFGFGLLSVAPCHASPAAEAP